MSDADMVYRLRLWRKAIDDGRTFDAIDGLATCQLLWGTRFTAKALRHWRLLERACDFLWGQTKALVARQTRVAA